MKKINFMAAIFVPFVCACSNENLESLASSNETLTSTRTAWVDTIPVFTSEAEFNQAVKTVSTLLTVEEKENWVKSHYGNYQSMQELYDNAMEEAADLGETREAYQDFKAKYNSLYFPLYKEDAGCYIPLKDLNAAYLVNANGNANINGKVVNKKDITSYQELMDLDRAYYVNEKPQLASSITNYETAILNADVENFGSDWDSGWRERDDQKRKVKLKMRRRIVGWKFLLHTEIAFRKHTWRGWANYKTDTTLNGTATMYLNELNDIYLNKEITYNDPLETGRSSHDGDTPIMICFGAKSFATRASFYSPRMTGTAHVYYQAMGNLDFDWSLNLVVSNKAQGNPFATPVSLMEIPAVPGM